MLTMAPVSFPQVIAISQDNDRGEAADTVCKQSLNLL